MDFIERCLGVGGLLNGQSFDLHYSTLPRTLETTENIAQGQDRLSDPSHAGVARHAGRGLDRELQQIERISIFWGLGYQIVDDLKDVLQTASETGKTAARDIELNRPNIAAAIGIGAAVRRLNRLIDLGDTSFAKTPGLTASNLISLRDCAPNSRQNSPG